MKIFKVNKIDFFIILILIIAAPVGYISKLVYKKNEIQDSGKYTIQISMKDKIDNLNHYNFNAHYNAVKQSIENKENLGYFTSCIIFNRYRDDLMMFNKSFYESEELFNKDKRRLELFNWCLSSYKYLKEDTPTKMVSAYYYSLGLANIYGFKNDIDISKGLTFLKRAYKIDKNPDINVVIQATTKYKNIYTEFKDSVIIPYIDNEIKNNKIR